MLIPILIGFAVLLVVIIICMMCSEPTKQNKILMVPCVNSRIHSRRIVATNKGPTTPHQLFNQNLPFMIPLFYSAKDEGCVVPVRLGLDYVYLVVDSGSLHIGVATADCLNRHKCVARDAGYNHEHSPTVKDLNKTVKLRYASLEIESELVQDTMHLQTVNTLCDGTSVSINTFSIPNVFIHAGTRMEGTHSNVIGLMQPYRDIENETPSFLETIFREVGGPRVWGFACTSEGNGVLFFSRVPLDCCVDLPVYIPLSKSMTYMGAYVLNIRAAYANDKYISFPKHMIVDTGTSESYLSDKYTQPMETLGFSNSNNIYRGDVNALPTLRIELEGGLELAYAPERYMWKESGGYRSTFHHNDTIEQLFQTSDVLLLGIAHMTGLCWIFDLDQQRVGISVFSS
jgi:hypothetical protein